MFDELLKCLCLPCILQFGVMGQEKCFYEDLDLESNETFRTSDGENYLKCNGFLFPPLIKKFADRIRKMEVRDDDIWVCSFPKSGTTWTQEMVWCLANGKKKDEEAVEKPIFERFPFLEISFFYGANEPMGSENSVEDVEKLASPRFIKTHLPFNLLPENLRNFSTNAKIIHVMRNPRDVSISFYHHLSKLFISYYGSFPHFVEMFFKGIVPYGPFPAHLKGYLAHEESPNILFLKYEEMKKDLRTVMHKTANFIGKSIGESEVEKLLDHLSFSKMKQNPAVNYRSVLEALKKSSMADKNEDQFMRRGIVGNWKEKLDPELCVKFQRWEDETMNGINFTFSV
ncbi:luciferin sulfotransferase-like [Planococcus citri]|uniref:luciferin sulfotransferase-like n=1 Tax=Planococcus citri TaxID=170843 RepID=UPI0031F9B2DE